ncbi:MAG: fused MFS/spermidine synthase, partial [Polyangiaceae bacterium]|nr:fused MFS/spermidine synthase [Polyangiaceae bacterium]
VALLGIGLGGLAYAFLGRRTPPTLGSFALTCLLEGLLIILPYALGDRVALLALTLREVGKLGFSGYLFCWSLVTGLVVLPAAFVSGVQFPMLIALLGQGKQEVGRQIGWTYAWNTGGAILGSLAGGFGLLPLLGVRGCWRLMAVLLAVLGGATLVLALRTGKRSSLLAPGVALLGILVLQGAQGPTALWRHAGIGAGRFTGQLENDNDIDRARNEVNQELLWETDGIESSVGIRVGHSYSFLVNGKSDGNALSDAGTQIMLGLLGVVLKPEARSALVIGLGTGSSGGWLGAVPSMERVDIVEIEPAIREVARRCAVINQNVLDNPKVHLYLADAREVLQTTARRYDLIVSEPSNPYRAGIASLYTKEFYQAANARLSEGGLLLQWVQGYEISAQTLRTIYATLHSVFPHVETWVMDASDLLLVATHRPQPLDASRIRQAIQQEPLRSALAYAWRVNDLEGVLAHFVANHELASVVAREEGEFLNVDDLSPVEFGFARAVGKQNLFSIDALADLARRRGEHRPAMVGEVDWSVVENRRFTRLFQKNRIPPPSPEYSLDQAHRLTAMQAYIQGRFAKVVSTWGRQSVGARETNELTELMILGHSLAEVGNENAWSLTEKLALALPLEALMIRGHLRYRQKRYDEATDLFEEALLRYRKDPWVYASLADRSLQTIGQLGSLDPKRGLRLLDALSQSFAVHAIEKVRLEVAFQLSLRQPDKSLCIEHLRPWEPFIPWEENFLKARFACYQDVNHPLAKKAEGDLLRYLTQAGMRFEAGLTPLERPLSPRSTASSAPPAPLEDPSSVASAVQTPASFAFPPLPSATATAPHP